MNSTIRRIAAVGAAAVALGAGASVAVPAFAETVPALAGPVPTTDPVPMPTVGPMHKAVGPRTAHEPRKAHDARTGGRARAAYVIPRCGTLDLKVTIGDWNGGVGHFYANLEFENTGRYTCHLYGYPGVSAVDGHGRQLGPDASRWDDAPARYVNILPGTSAHAVVGYVQALDYDPSVCKPAAAKDFEVFPPADKYSEEVAFTSDVCTTKTDVLSVGRVQPGTVSANL